MKNKKKIAEKTKPQESGKSCFLENINTCIACGREIPEGMLVCMECEKVLNFSRCTICDAILQENEISLCTRCREMFMRLKNTDQQ